MAQKKKEAPAKEPKAKTEEVKKAAPKPKGKDYKKVMEGILAKLKKDPLTRREMINLLQQELV